MLRHLVTVIAVLTMLTGCLTSPVITPSVHKLSKKDVEEIARLVDNHPQVRRPVSHLYSDYPEHAYVTCRHRNSGEAGAVIEVAKRAGRWEFVTSGSGVPRIRVDGIPVYGADRLLSRSELRDVIAEDQRSASSGRTTICALEVVTASSVNVHHRPWDPAFFEYTAVRKVRGKWRALEERVVGGAIPNY